LEIIRWFEEKQSAAKRGRPVFADMLRRIKRGEASGVVIHKIDRSARNLGDWAVIGEMIDASIDVHFAAESVDLNSRGGRLSADMLAVIAADYSRNLRAEIKKGIQGRLKQGVYPFGAPIGYLNCGRGGKLKEIDPMKGPLVRRAFELYATGNHTLYSLRDTLHRLGLRNVKGGQLSITGVSTLLNNPFYVGVLRVGGETYIGRHEPLISHALFEQVRRVLLGLTNVRVHRHDHLYRRRFACKSCGRSLIASKVKGHVYYRCATIACPSTSVREEAIDSAVRRELGSVGFTPKQLESLRLHAARLIAQRQDDTEKEAVRLKAAVGDVTARLNRLVDAFVEGGIEKGLFESRQAALVMERSHLDENLELLRRSPETFEKALEIVITRAANALEQFETRENPAERRELLDQLTFNRVVEGKNIDVALVEPYRELAKQRILLRCAHEQDVPLTLARIVRKLWAWLTTHSEEAARIVESEVMLSAMSPLDPNVRKPRKAGMSTHEIERT
jgi:site-specific DNA recombinase